MLSGRRTAGWTGTAQDGDDADSRIVSPFEKRAPARLRFGLRGCASVIDDATAGFAVPPL